MPVELAQISEGAVIGQVGRGLIVTSLLLEHWQPLPVVTVMVIWAGDVVPAVQVIWLVLLPEVMEPLVMLQL